MKNPLLIIILSFVVVLTSCRKYRNDDKLSIARRDYVGDQLRVDGYFYRIGYKGEINDGYWFFRNGVLVSAGGITQSVPEMDDYMLRVIQNGYYKTRKIAWGVFKVEDDNISFERWYPHGPNVTYVREGKILDETTFHITESYRVIDGVKTDIKERDEMYYFRPFDAKPDSTNSFIK